MKNKFISFLIRFLFGFFLLAFGLNANATPPDFSTLTAAVDFSTVISAMMVIFAALAGVFIVSRGGGMVLSKIRGR